MTLRELEKFVNELAKQMQELTERVNHLEILRTRVGLELPVLSEEDQKKINEALKDFHLGHPKFCGSQ